MDPRGKTAIEAKEGVKSTLGRSPDLAESLMLALGEPTYEPFVYRPIGNTFVFGNSPSRSHRPQREIDAEEDAANDAARRARLSGFSQFNWRRRGTCW